MVAIGSSLGGAAGWASTVTQPATSTVVAPVDGQRHLVALTISAVGFAPNTPVFVEQCDGTNPETPQWSPTEHCDLGTSPAPVNASGAGAVTFSTSDSSHAFTPFVGESPQSLFNCNPGSAHAPNNGLANFTNCQLRVSSNDSMVTADQQFVALRIPADATNGPRPTKAPATSSTTVPHVVPKTSKTSTRRAGASRSTHSGTARASAPNAAAPAAAISSASAGALSLSDLGVLSGYVLLLVGVAAAALSVFFARSRNAIPRS